MAIVKWIGIVLVAILSVLAVTLLMMRREMRNPSYEWLRQKYAGPPVGSSSGATVAVMYPAAQSKWVRAQTLATLPLSTSPPAKAPWIDSAIEWTHDNLLPNYNSKFRFRRSLQLLHGTPSRLKPETVN